MIFKVEVQLGGYKVYLEEGLETLRQQNQSRRQNEMLLGVVSFYMSRTSRRIFLASLF